MDYNLSLFGFILAMTGWMPLPLSVTIYQSVWVKEKIAVSGGGYDRELADRDLAVGWTLTLALALCFVIMGTAILFQSGSPVPNDAVGFATSLFSIFTGLVGDWIYPVIAVSGVAVIWSTLLAIMDANPRMMARIVIELRGGEGDADASLYRGFLGLLILIVILIMGFFLKDFAAFIDFATGAAFVFSPALAYYNHRAILSAEIDPAHRPGKSLLVSSWAAIVLFTLFAIGFFCLRFSLFQ